MISAIVAALSVVTLLVTTSLLISKGVDMKKQYDDRLQVMTDQVNNAQYYNSEVDKKQNSNIKDIRSSYTSKDELSRSVDTKEFSAKKAQAQDLQAQSITGDYMKSAAVSTSSMIADKIIAPGSIMSSLDASKVNTGRMNLVGDSYGRGAINFSSSAQGANKDEYLLQRGIQENKDNIVMKLPKDAQMSFQDGNNKTRMSMQPSSGSIKFGDKWILGNSNLDSLDLNYDNSAILNFKKDSAMLNTPLTLSKGSLTLNNNTNELIQFTANDTQKGLYTTGELPLTIDAKETKIGALSVKKDMVDVAGIKFGSNANFINNDKEFVIKGNPKIGLSNDVKVYGKLTTDYLFAPKVETADIYSWNYRGGNASIHNIDARNVKALNLYTDTIRADKGLTINNGDDSNSITQLYGNLLMNTGGLSVGTREFAEPGSIKTTGTVTSSYIFAQSNQDMHINRGRDGNNIALYGKVQVGSGGLSVGTWEPTETGSINTTGYIRSSYLFAQSNQDMHLNRGRDSNNIALYGGVQVGSGGLNVGNWEKAAPGSVRATGYVQSSYLFAHSNQDMHLNRDRDSNNIALYGGVQVGSGGLNVGNWEKADPGSIRATGFIQSSYIFAQSNQDMHLNRGRNTNNISLYGGVKVGSGGLSVGTWNDVPYGMVRTTDKFCINNTCLSEPEIQKIKSMVIS